MGLNWNLHKITGLRQFPQGEMEQVGWQLADELVTTTDLPSGWVRCRGLPHPVEPGVSCCAFGEVGNLPRYGKCSWYIFVWGRSCSSALPLLAAVLSSVCRAPGTAELKGRG